MTGANAEAVPFDFEAHRRAAVEQYGRRRDLYRAFAETVRDILADATKDLRINDIQFRAKDLESFGKKASTPAEQNSDEPKYKHPMADITDLAGVRVLPQLEMEKAFVR